MSEAIVRVTRAEDQDVEWEIIATRGGGTLWEGISYDEAAKLGLPADPYETDDNDKVTINGVEYWFMEGQEWSVDTGDHESTSEIAHEAISDRLAERGAVAVGDLFAATLIYEGDGQWSVTIEPTLSVVFAAEGEVR
jgi:hypothetical protein